MRNFNKKTMMCWLSLMALLFCAIPTMAQKQKEIQRVPSQVLNQTNLISTKKMEMHAKNTSSSSRRISKLNRANGTLGTATSSYLDITQYASIDDAIWKTDNNEQFYKYTENNGVGWLSIPVYSAFDVVNSNYQEENCQRWIDYQGIENEDGDEVLYSLVLADGNTWPESAPFAGGDYFFGNQSKRAYGLYTTDDEYYNTTEQNIGFYVTNCTAVQLLGYNFGGTVQGSGWNSRNYPATLRAYECTNNNGTLTVSNTALTQATNYTQSTDFTLSINGLDPNKIYKIVGGVYCSMLYEIAFQTITETQGTALSSYLDIAKYETIDAAGWRTALVNNLYKYTEHETQKVAWLTLPVYGGFVGARYATNNSTVGSGHPQQWIECDLGTNNTYGGTTWTYTATATYPYNGSSTYFTSATARAIGYNSRTNTSVRTVSFYVTNTTEVKLYGTGRNGSDSNYPARLRIYECTENNNGTVTASTTATVNQTNSGTSTFTLESGVLDKEKIYKVEVSIYRGYLYEIGFKTPLPSAKIIAEPTALNFETIIGVPQTKSFTVTGTDLEGDVTATLNDANGVFSIGDQPTITIAQADATADYTVNVTFNSATAGTFTGSITLSSQNAESVTVNLNGVAHAPELIADPEELTFDTEPGTPVTGTFDVLGDYLKGDVTLTLNDANGVFSISPATISKADAEEGATVTVTFSPTANGEYTGTVVLTSEGVEPVTVTLNGTAYPDGFPVTIGTYGVTTLYVDFPLIIPYDTYDPDILGVYYVKEISDGEAKFKRLENDIPANTAVVIQGNANTADIPAYIFPRNKGAVTPLPSENLLSGSLEQTTPAAVLEAADAPEGSIVMTLGRGNMGYIGFYKYSGKFLNPNKAYIIYTPAGSGVNSLSIGGIEGDDFTGIKEVGLTQEGAWYTVQGTRLNSKPRQSGIYIHNGKAVVVK